MTITDLAERVGLSVSPCHRRLRALKQTGAISGYYTHPPCAQRSAATANQPVDRDHGRHIREDL